MTHYVIILMVWVGVAWWRH